MFSLREWLKEGYLDAVGKRPDFWIILNATGWYRDGVLLEEDLAEIKAKIDKKNTPVEEISAENSENSVESSAESVENTAEENELSSDESETNEENVEREVAE